MSKIKKGLTVADETNDGNAGGAVGFDELDLEGLAFCNLVIIESELGQEDLGQGAALEDGNTLNQAGSAASSIGGKDVNGADIRDADLLELKNND